MIDKKSKAYLIGGGIASLSAAVYLIQDGGIEGKNITIFDESKRMGGSLDARNVVDSGGYSMRGIRVFYEEAYTCMFALMARLPSLNNPKKTIREEFVDFNKKNKAYLRARLLKDGQAVDSRKLKLSIGDRLRMIRLFLQSDAALPGVEMREYFTPSFFTSNFWYEFSTLSSFQPWHSIVEFRRYFRRFIQNFPNIDTLKGIEISPRNQYECLVLPIVDWLEKQGVQFITDIKIIDLAFADDQSSKTVNRMYYERAGNRGEIIVEEHDYVFVTLGSIVANSSIGSMTKAPVINYEEKSAAWTLWENIAKNRPEFGRPAVFNTHIDKSQWVSFTITFHDHTFFSLMEKFMDKRVTAYGGVNLIESNWLASVFMFYRPYFLDQPDTVDVCWGYGLNSEKEGNFIKKKMSECAGEEILTELVYHLGFEDHLEEIIGSAVCIPCMAPYITSHFLPRKLTDRPAVVPKGSTNLAFLGQYCEIPDDVVFTIEYSVRSAQIAVYSLLKLDKQPSPIYKGTHHIGVVYNALKTILR